MRGFGPDCRERRPGMRRRAALRPLPAFGNGACEWLSARRGFAQAELRLELVRALFELRHRDLESELDVGVVRGLSRRAEADDFLAKLRSEERRVGKEGRSRWEGD